MHHIRRAALLSALVAILASVFAMPAAAGSPFVERYSDKGREAIADGGDCSFDGTVDRCEFTFIRAHDGWVKNNGEVLRGTILCLEQGVDSYNTVTDEWSLDIRSGCGPAAVSIAKDLSSASASGTITVDREQCDNDGCQTDGSVPVDLTLEVEGWGDLGSSRNHFVDEWGGCRISGNGRGTFNEGDAAATVDSVAVDIGYGHIAEGRSKFSVACRG
ncbi:MAG: hypothetical protein PVG27_08620 [Chloroflexota bacterium]|jgi:hypothetical protein